jgi:hypothetical protein
MTVEGSDCGPTGGKRQFANKKAAQAAARAGRAQGHSTLSAFRCRWCGCFHIGNARGSNSKGRTRR